ncbi:uncharacterized protein LOC125681636 [Ostrea edulis]|uniref:uncharacterized protein LOC125660726 n=1 Tax=Ostrea edulis TaxID=37623 RepID=UPI0020945CD8|nr:uncharacterized protein LOC125660726 [Ostrea edulis]XP_048749505.2 uncharacterized protein LOC125661518 [Ostrea edulis]XP_048777757.2 uncharacterized protein LOC125681636 [Ostrea edulis]XP_056007362.1 uncharacterized protein LOC125681636 [Ostrea edulis]
MSFFHLHKKWPITAMLWIVSKEPPSPTLDIPYVEDLLLGEAYTSATDKIQWLKTNLAIQREKIEQVAQLTVGQRNNHLWALVRKNRLTASNFGKVLAAIRRNRFPPSLFKQVLGSYDLSTKDAILWGINNESVAKAKYCSYGDAVVEETGVWLHESGVLGASPDGIIRRAATHKYNHQVAQLTDILETMKLMSDILEVKCPFSARNMTIPEAILSIKDFCLDFQVHDGRQMYKLKEDHIYYNQVQGQLHIQNKSACDFVVWTTKDIAIVRVLQDSAWDQNIAKLIDFYFTQIIPIVQK